MRTVGLTWRVLRTVLQVAVGAVLVATIVTLLGPRLFGLEVVTVLSGSMSPTYPVDSVLILDPDVTAREIERGDVIMFTPEDRDLERIAHRVIEVRTEGAETMFVTKGDNSEDIDLRPVPAYAVDGRVEFGVPWLGWYVRAVHTGGGLMVFLVLPLAALCAWPAMSLFLKRARRKHAQATTAGTADTAADTAADTSATADGSAWHYWAEILVIVIIFAVVGGAVWWAVNDPAAFGRLVGSE